MHTRACYRCKQDFPATSEFFYSDASRPLGLSYECRACLRDRNKGRDRRTERWANLSLDQRKKVRERQRRYAKTDKGRAIFLAKAYEAIDKAKGQTSEVTQMFLLEQIFPSRCVYCGTVDRLGCDRIDNAKGHTLDNIVPACGDCNVMRGDRFTFSEMQVIGAAVAQVRALRGTTSTATESEAHP
jgi:hypothetical protein